MYDLLELGSGFENEVVVVVVEVDLVGGTLLHWDSALGWECGSWSQFWLKHCHLAQPMGLWEVETV